MNPIDDKPRTDSATGNSRVDACSDTVDDSSAGLLIVGHGTRDAAGVAEFLVAARRIAERVAPLAVESCFLELAAPTIDTAVARLAAAGSTRITVAPLILFAAGHAKRDIPDAAAQTAARHSASIVGQLPHLGCRPELVALSARRYREALVDNGDDRSGPHHRQRRSKYCCSWSVGGAAMRKPRPRCNASPACAPPLRRSAGWRSHLRRWPSRAWKRRSTKSADCRFEGSSCSPIYSSQANSWIAFGRPSAAAERYPERQWIVAGHLGPEEELVASVCMNLKESKRAGNID